MRPGEIPNIQIAIDGDGVGATTADVLEEKHGIIAQRIRWGKRMHTKKDKERFINQRAYAKHHGQNGRTAGTTQV